MMQHMTMTHHLPSWEDERSKSPHKTLKKPSFAQDKLKKLTTHLGTGASRNSASKGILSTGGPKTTKNKKMKSPKYMTQGASGYYMKGKQHNSVISG
jgi:hypothetical protein